MNRRALPVWSASLCLLLVSCSDDSSPPPPLGETGPRDGGAGDHKREKGWPWDGFDPKCPMGDPCVYQTKGEGKHKEDYAVIGERLTLSGKGLGAVDTVFLGATIAPLISASPTQVICRVGPGTPSGEHSIEVAAGSSRRKYTSVTVRRLVVPVAADHTQITGWDALTHAGGPELTLGHAPAATPTVSATGRYLLVPGGAGKAQVVDLAQEAVASVSGLPSEAVTSITTDPEDRSILIATSGGTLLSADLGAFPALTAKSVGSVPSTSAVVRFGSGKQAGFVGLHPTVASLESSLWSSAIDLKAGFVQQAGKPFLVGSGAGLQPIELSAGDDTIALLALDGGVPQLALLSIAATGVVSGVGSAASTGALSLAIAAGGKQVAIGSDAASPTLGYTASGAVSLKQISLGGTGAQRVIPVRVPTRAGVVVALVGPKPSGASFVAGALELCDLSTGTRITAAGSKPALELAGIRAVVADTAVDLLHLLTGTDYQTYSFAITGSSATLTEKPPSRPLATGKDYRWILAQP